MITLPSRGTKKHAEELLQKNASWFLEKVAEIKARPPSPLDHLTDEDYQQQKERAREIITRRASYYSNAMNVSYGRLAIRNQKTRWGSCSNKGNLNFNYKLMYLPQDLLDYVVVHELCHLTHLNHSKKFWDAVKEVLPDYKERQKKLKAYHLSLD